MLERLKNLFGTNNNMTFLDHIESLRWHIIRSVLVLCVVTAVMFFYNDFIFNTILFGPTKPTFITYRALCHLSKVLHLGVDLCMNQVNINLINTVMAGQLMMSIWGTFIAALIVTIPYIIWELWRFIKPALKDKELKSARGFVAISSLLFLTGALFSYYIIVPWTVTFLSSFRMSGAVVQNFIDVRSYISMVTTLVLWSGVIFELPVVSYILTSIGIISPTFLKKYRRHAAVVILVVAALIAPPDVASQVIVSIPLFILFEVSIFVSKYAERKKRLKTS
ncbi:MAG TPA: twin-arginine translocase subunit TatC [Bacteroidia bacterium]|jgi:sec-independent protein translocase protein TatC|nr:twin-arginine translocase subunit TatC [Bacteroidia bacterium]